MIRNYKFRLYPNSVQKYKLQNTLAACRWVYNTFVELAQNNFISRNDLNHILTELKQQEPWLYSYHSKMLQMISTQLEGAEKSLIELNKKGYKIGKLRFVKYEEYRTFIYNQSGYKLEQHGDKKLLHLSRIGFIEIRMHREIPSNANIKQIIVTKSKSQKWHACITCDIDEPILNMPKINLLKSVGIDVGIKTFVYDSDGQQIPNSENLKKMLKPLAKVQRKISRRKKGSNNRLKAIKHMQRIHERIVNRRRDFQHKLSKQYATNNDVVFVEKLEKTNMVKNHRLSRSIMDASWETFLEKLEYKCKMVIKVPARNTTIDCCRCGNKVPKSLAVRIHRCNVCNLVIDRDHNASINILKKGLKIFNQLAKTDCALPQELREVTLVEMLGRQGSKKKPSISQMVAHQAS